MIKIVCKLIRKIESFACAVVSFVEKHVCEIKVVGRKKWIHLLLLHLTYCTYCTFVILIFQKRRNVYPVSDRKHSSCTQSDDLGFTFSRNQYWSYQKKCWGCHSGKRYSYSFSIFPHPPAPKHALTVPPHTSWRCNPPLYWMKQDCNVSLWLTLDVNVWLNQSLDTFTRFFLFSHPCFFPLIIMLNVLPVFKLKNDIYSWVGL